MGGLRFVALALLAPAFVLPALATSTELSAASAGTSTHVAQHADRAAQPVGVRRDLSLSSAGSARGDSTTRGAEFTRRLHPPAHVRILAARLYWGAGHPSYPSTTRMKKDLHQTAQYFHDASRGRERVRSVVTRWVHVDVSGDVMCNTQRGSVRAAAKALRKAGYHPKNYNRLMLFTEQCNAASSAAQLPGRVSWIRFRSPGMATMVHELGHNLGLEHAYGVVCHEGARRVALGGSCLPVEYGDSWDAMGHSRGLYSAATLSRLGWAGRIQTVNGSGTFDIANVEHSGRAIQALCIPAAGDTTYWVEYQPQHSPQVGRTIPGVMIRRQVGNGPVEMIDASPGNPTGIAYPDADLTNSALPVGSSLTTPDDIRITTVAVARGASATVEVTFGSPAAVPDQPVVDSATYDGQSYRVHWAAPADNGQIVLGYEVTAWPSGTSQFVRSPAAYRTSLQVKSTSGGQPTSFSVKALNQVGWSADSAQVAVTPTP